MTSSTPSSDRSPSAGPAAVLFDLDGTLVDSERVWLDVITARLAGLGASMSSAQLAGFEGLSSIDAARALLALEGSSAPASDLAAELEEITLDSFAGSLEWIAGAEEALAHLRRERIRIGLVTSSTRAWVDAVAENVSLGVFDVVVTADDVGRTKPSPEPYLRATGLLDVDPAACLVFEDSEVGVRAAVAAGCRVVQVRADQRGASGTTACIPHLRTVTAPWAASLMPSPPPLP
ncbi:HAD family hydrolase [Microbacterium sp. NPDC091662]|uniref:HAD family hydrolase n=1 Tax=Microbacterium sp. NPDC091662 TaxID=3364211 RepID=UPI00380D6B91